MNKKQRSSKALEALELECDREQLRLLKLQAARFSEHLQLQRQIHFRNSQKEYLV